MTEEHAEHRPVAWQRRHRRLLVVIIGLGLLILVPLAAIVVLFLSRTMS